MKRDGAAQSGTIRIDGGMAANQWLCQFLADILEARIERPQYLETTALGAAFLAGLATGVWSDLRAIEETWKRRDAFEPAMRSGDRETLVNGWRTALARTLTRE
jgi:glycerol kinase